MKLHALSILSARNRKPVRKSNAYGIEMRLNGIFTVGDYLFLDIGLHNRTNLAYSVDELRFSVDDRKIARETNVQSVEIIPIWRSEEHTSELQSLMRISYAVFCLKKKKNNTHNTTVST